MHRRRDRRFRRHGDRDDLRSSPSATEWWADGGSRRAVLAIASPCRQCRNAEPPADLRCGCARDRRSRVAGSRARRCRWAWRRPRRPDRAMAARNADNTWRAARSLRGLIGWHQGHRSGARRSVPRMCSGSRRGRRSATATSYRSESRQVAVAGAAIGSTARWHRVRPVRLTADARLRWPGRSARLEFDGDRAAASPALSRLEWLVDRRTAARACRPRTSRQVERRR